MTMFRSEPVNEGHAGNAPEGLVDLVLGRKQTIPRIDGLYLDSDFETPQDMVACVIDITCVRMPIVHQ